MSYDHFLHYLEVIVELLRLFRSNNKNLCNVMHIVDPFISKRSFEVNRSFVSIFFYKCILLKAMMQRG